jgi:hypothetical protein
MTVFVPKSTARHLADVVREVVASDRAAQLELAKAGHLVDQKTMALTDQMEQALAYFDSASVTAEAVAIRDVFDSILASLDLPRAQMIHRVRAAVTAGILLIDFRPAAPQ